VLHDDRMPRLVDPVLTPGSLSRLIQPRLRPRRVLVKETHSSASDRSVR
jgi:hypothetical protein